jgi:death-on-curing protein
MAGFGDHEKYPTIAEKAAACLYYLATGHCFVDRNKRTSYSAAFMFLDLNGYDLIAEDEEIFDLVLSIADTKSRPPFKIVVD